MEMLGEAWRPDRQKNASTLKKLQVLIAIHKCTVPSGQKPMKPLQ